MLSKFTYPPKIIGLSETNIQADKRDAFIPTLKGYDFVRDDSKLRVGGSGIFIKSNLDFTIRKDLYLNVNDCENVWVEISAENKKIVVASVYRHPRYNFSEYQDALLKTLENIYVKKQLFLYFGRYELELAQVL